MTRGMAGSLHHTEQADATNALISETNILMVRGDELR